MNGCLVEEVSNKTVWLSGATGYEQQNLARLGYSII